MAVFVWFVLNGRADGGAHGWADGVRVGVELVDPSLFPFPFSLPFFPSLIYIYIYFKNGHIYKNWHNSGQKQVPRHDSDAIPQEIR